MEVGAVLVNLPNLNQRASYRLSARVQYPSAEVGDLAHGGSQGIVDHNQVIIGVERELVWIEGPLGLSRSLYKLRGKCSRHSKSRCPKGQSRQEIAAAVQQVVTISCSLFILHHVTGPPRILLCFSAGRGGSCPKTGVMPSLYHCRLSIRHHRFLFSY